MSENRMEKINRFTRKELTEDDVYCFSVILCDNEIDRDCEKFSVEALKELAGLFIGKTGIFNHDPKGENQTARIFDTEIESDPTRKTADGEEYTCLKAEAYMVKTPSNADLIKEIDGGIKKEVSVGCSVSKQICSVCGAERNSGMCLHKKGKSYGGKLCYHILSVPTDAYEWSFVAVPAQKGAGVTKRYTEGGTEKTLENVGIAEMLCEELRREIIGLSYLSGDGIPAALTKAAIERMEPEELLEIKRALSEKVSSRREQGEIEKALAKPAENDHSSFRV